MDITAPETNAQSTQVIVSIALHQIDVETQRFNIIPITSDVSDLNSYLDELLVEVDSSDKKREYIFARNTTEFYTTLVKYREDNTLLGDAASNILAGKLLQDEIRTDEKYGHLGSKKKGHVKKGSFLQFLYSVDSELFYLGVKMEHQVFIDEEDFKRKVGLSVANKIYKACKVSFDENGNPRDVHVYDTNTKPAVYWWNDFLALKEVRTDEYNTRIASKEVIKVISRIKTEFPSDHTILKNSIIGAFKQEAEMKYSDFIDSVVRTYSPQDAGLIDKMPGLITRLEALPTNKNFDTTFTLKPGEVSFRRSPYKLSKEITLFVDDGVENLNDKVWSEETVSGKKLVVIESPVGFSRFSLKERVK